MQDQCSVFRRGGLCPAPAINKCINCPVSRQKRGAKYWTRIISILSVTFFSNFRPENLKKNCPKDTLKMLHLCKCHETNVVDLWPREGWVCPVNLTDRERMVKLLNAASLDSWGSPFLWSNFLFFPAKKQPSKLSS